ncbi:Olfactory receptor 2D3, partial [Aptenodytes patagonicus]
VLFSTMCVVTVVGNACMTLIIRMDSKLHAPMYFFLKNLSILDICYSSVITLKAALTFSLGRRIISYNGCAPQMFFFFHFGTTEALLRHLLLKDTYLPGHCNPLHYTTIMDRRACLWLALRCWLRGFLAPVLPTAFIFRLPFRGSNIINHFFCDSPPLLELSCQDVFEIEVINFVVGTIVLMSSFNLTMISYIFIVATTLHIPTAEGRSKAFSTCVSHLTIVTIFYRTTIFMYICTKTIQTFDFNKTVSVFYSMVTPVLNTVIYSLRNNDIKQGVRKVL